MLFRFFAPALCIVGLFAFSACNSEKQKDTPPNVLIILADDLGYGDVSTYGNTVFSTPKIDQLVESGVLFTDFYVPTPYCAPSRATILTGRFPLRHGLIRNPTPDTDNPLYRNIGLAEEEITLAEVLRESGYATQCIGKWHLGHEEKYFPVNQGFDNYFGILYSNDMRPVQLVEDRDTVEYPVDQSTLTMRYTQRALEFIRENKETPFFLHLCHAMPHKPLAASEQFYTPETPGDLYNDVINELDWSVGKIMDELKALDILENTVVVFMSDNGPWYGGSTGGLKGMKATPWEGGIRVPFIMHFPRKFQGGKTVEVPCWSADLFPTILALTGVDMPDSLVVDGEDIARIVQGESLTHGAIYGMKGDQIMSVRKGDYKLYVNTPRPFKPRDAENWVDPRGPDGTTIIAPNEQSSPAQYPGLKPTHSGEAYQLYDLKNDPTESTDISNNFPAVVEDLKSEYAEFTKRLEI